MSDQRIAELYERLIAAKFKIERPRLLYPYQLGWNAAIDLAIQKMRTVCDDDHAQSEAAE